MSFIPIGIGGKEVKFLFDTGNGDGIFITTAVKGKVDYSITGKATEHNPDGTYRGESSTVLIKSIDVFGQEYTNIESSLTNWRMFGFFKINGAVGLKYFKDRVITLDYRNRKIAVSSKAIDYRRLRNDKYTVLPLISSELNNEEDLMFFQGEVNGKKSTIYLDTGATRSFLNPEDSKAPLVELKLGSRRFEFKTQKLKHEEIGFKDNFEYPLRMAINSDLLKSNHFVLTIDRIQNKLIISQN